MTLPSERKLARQCGVLWAGGAPVAQRPLAIPLQPV